MSSARAMSYSERFTPLWSKGFPKLGVAGRPASTAAAGNDWENNDLVLPGENGKPMASRWDYEQWHQALDNAGLPRRRLHDARHTCATLLLEDGVDIEVIRQYLGNLSVELTSRTYLHKSAKTVTRVSETVSRIRHIETKGKVA